LRQLWEVTTGEDRCILAYSLFDELIYNLDARRIIDFKIKPCHEPFIELRTVLYADEMREEKKTAFTAVFQVVGRIIAPTGLEPRGLSCTPR
jgi:hypothetical protein